MCCCYVWAKSVVEVAEIPTTHSAAAAEDLKDRTSNNAYNEALTQNKPTFQILHNYTYYDTN